VSLVLAHCLAVGGCQRHAATQALAWPSAPYPRLTQAISKAAVACPPCLILYLQKQNLGQPIGSAGRGGGLEQLRGVKRDGHGHMGQAREGKGKGKGRWVKRPG
jgi:hypothetical protein